MARPRNPNQDRAYEIYREHNGNISNREIAAILDEDEKVVAVWKSRGKWNVVQQSNKSCTTKEKHIKQNIKTEAEAVAEAIDQVISNPDLTDKQQLFCVLYAMGDSIVSAYQKSHGCSYNTAAVEGCRSLKKPKIKEEVERLKKARFEAQLFGEHDIYQWYLDVAMANITDFVTFGREEVQAMGAFGPIADKETGEPIMKEVNFVKFKESAEVNGHVIKKVKLGKDGASIELYDSMQAMNWLSEHMSMGTGVQQGLANSIMQAYQKRKDQTGQRGGSANTEEALADDT